ncbi:MAG: hypothetical protein CMO55_13610 [Verrucomicrobiales bacterium]|nr:hypothetical protein [Verrucomicrobiales bacterium]
MLHEDARDFPESQGVREERIGIRDERRTQRLRAKISVSPDNSERSDALLELPKQNFHYVTNLANTTLE